MCPEAPLLVTIPLTVPPGAKAIVPVEVIVPPLKPLPAIIWVIVPVFAVALFAPVYPRSPNVKSLVATTPSQQIL